MLKEIPNYPNYFADTNGNIYSNKRSSLIKLKVENHSSGYLYVNLYEKGKRKHARVHRLIAMTFIDNPENKPTINHIDGDKTNNEVSNLEWATVSENTKHAFDNNLAYNDSGYEDNQSHHIIAIRLFDKKNFKFGSARQAAKELDVSVSTIMRQIKGQSRIDKRSRYEFQTDMKCND